MPGAKNIYNNNKTNFLKEKDPLSLHITCWSTPSMLRQVIFNLPQSSLPACIDPRYQPAVKAWTCLRSILSMQLGLHIKDFLNFPVHSGFCVAYFPSRNSLAFLPQDLGTPLFTSVVIFCPRWQKVVHLP